MPVHAEPGDNVTAAAPPIIAHAPGFKRTVEGFVAHCSEGCDYSLSVEGHSPVLKALVQASVFQHAVSTMPGTVQGVLRL